MLTSLHIEGRSPLHRLGAGLKLGGLALASIGLFWVTSTPILLLCFALSVLSYLSSGIGLVAGLRRLLPLLLSLAFLILFNFFFLPAHEVAVLALRILALVFCASAVTATTPLGEMMTVVDRLTQPLERLGVLRPGDAGLALGLCLRFVPDILGRYETLREAHRARGLKLRLATLLGPLTILTLKQADEVAMAIDARGLRRSGSTSSTQRDPVQ